MRRTRFASLAFTFCLGLLWLLSSPSLSAQLSAVSARVAGPVDDSARITLRGGVSALARSEFDKGSVAASTEMNGVRIVFSRSAEQQAALDKLLAEQLDPNSSNYRKWLTPEQFGRQFGPADSDVAAITAWLESHGLRVGALPAGRTHITFSGTAAQLEEAFHTSIHSFNDGERQFLANVASPQIPAAFAPVIAGVARLDTIQPRPHAVKGDLGHYDTDSKVLAPAAVGPRAQLTGSSGSSLYVVPGDAATIYNTPNSTLNVNFSGSTSYTGQGVTIGIGGDATINASTVVAYRAKFLGDSTAPTISYCTNATTANPTSTCSTTNPGNITTADTDEAYIDTQLAGGIAPGASIHYYASNDLFSAVEKAINDNQVDIFSLSFGACESSLGTGNNSYVNALWQQAASQGIVVTVSTGDNGSAGCDNNNKVAVASLGLAVNGLASTPYNLAIGGTDFYPLASSSTFGTYVGSTNSSATLYRTAKSYIPEDTWNQSTSTNLKLAQNVPYRDSSNATNIVAASGGKSACATMSGSSCSAGYAKPSWQRGTGVPTDSVRDIPDVSIFGSSGAHNASWLVCTDDTGTVSGTTVTANCTAQSNGNFYFMGFGGTSTSAPAFAGMLALVQQKVGGRIGLNAAKTLYDLYNGSHASAIFHDTIQGNVSVFCTSGTPNCSSNTAGNLFLTGYDTGTGYDLATGLGSVDVTQLVTYWGSSTGSAASTVTAAATPSTATTNQSISVAITVTGGSGTPTGTVTVSNGGYVSADTNLVSGAATIVIPAGSLVPGNDKLNVTYSGDSVYATASGSTTVTVTALTATVGLAQSATSIYSSQSMTVTATVTGSGPTPTGAVSLSGGGYTASGKALTGGTYTFTIPGGSLAVGTDTLTVAYSGDSIYAANSNAVTVVVATPPTATVTVTPASGNIVSSQALSVAVAVTGTAATPTGSVTLSGGGYTSSATNLTAGAATISIPANSLSVGTDTLTVTYNGDTTYASKTGSTTVTVKAPYSMTGTAPSAVAKGTAATSTITLTADASYTGTVALTCALTSSTAGINDVPTCTVTQSIAINAGTPAGTATLTVNSTAAQAALQPHGIPTWTGAGGGAVLALLVFLGIPARRKSWRNLVGLVVLLVALGTLSACGGGGGGSTTKDTGTTAGAYTFTITGTGNPAVTPAPTTTVSVTIN